MTSSEVLPPTHSYRADGLQLAWDSTSLARLLECPRKYYYSNQAGIQPREMSPHLTFGIYYHKACEYYDHKRSSGLDHETAIRETIRFIHSQCRSWESDNTYKNRNTLLRTVVWYLAQFRNDPFQTIQLADGRPAVELSFRFNLALDSEQGDPYLICGHMDRLAIYQGSPWILDRKTTKSQLGPQLFAQFSPHVQFPIYTIAGKIVYQTPVRGLIVDAAQILVEGSRFMRAPIHFSASQLEEFLNLFRYQIKLAERYHRSSFWPMNPMACHNYGGCPFRGVCSKPPETRDKFLEVGFIEHRWDPLEVRGDI